MTALRVFQAPTLGEFLTVLHNVRKSEIAQYEALSAAFDADRIAATQYMSTGPRWVYYAGERPVVVCGFSHLGNGVYQDWLYSTDEAWGPHWREVTRICKRTMDGMLDHGARRLQCVTLASRIDVHKWYRVLDLTYEGTLKGLGRNGEDAFLFSRTRTVDEQR